MAMQLIAWENSSLNELLHVSSSAAHSLAVSHERESTGNTCCHVAADKPMRRAAS